MILTSSPFVLDRLRRRTQGINGHTDAHTNSGWAISTRRAELPLGIGQTCDRAVVTFWDLVDGKCRRGEASVLLRHLGPQLEFRALQCPIQSRAEGNVASSSEPAHGQTDSVSLDRVSVARAQCYVLPERGRRPSTSGLPLWAMDQMSGSILSVAELRSSRMSFTTGIPRTTSSA